MDSYIEDKDGFRREINRAFLTYVAISDEGRPIPIPYGLDIQTTSPPHSDVLRIARRFFPLDEYELLAAIKDRENQLELFFRLWSIKEAYLKYCGCGLRADLNSFLIRPVPQIPSMQDKRPDTQDKGMDTAEKIQKGSLSVLKKEDLLSPAEYALLSGPPGYTLAVCAETIPDRIQIHYI